MRTLSISTAILLGLSGCVSEGDSSANLSDLNNAQSVNTLSQDDLAAGWQLLFDGYSSAGWRGAELDHFPEKGWQIVDGELRTGDSSEERGGDIVTIGKYGDLELSFEWNMSTKGGNSGVKYAVAEAGPDVRVVGLEYQILDDTNFEWMADGRMKPNDYRTLASLYELYPPDSTKQALPIGEWNFSRIHLEDNHIEHWLNGKRVLSVRRGTEDWYRQVAASKFHDVDSFGESPMGHILIQDHGSAVAFRNIKIRVLD